MKPSDGAAPIHSSFASDPEMLELIQMYVEEMPGRIAELEGSWRASRLDDLSRYAHQLKGASAGYGFESIGSAAARLEELTKHTEPDLALVRRELTTLLDLCGRTAV